jgi:hypothetical protein
MTIGPVLARPDAANGFQGDFVARVARSFAHVTGRDLFAEAGIDPAEPGASAWRGSFALLTHRGDAAALLNYGNRFALDLWEMDWDQFTATPSAATAPDDDIAERRQMMDQVARSGFVSGYEGRRISRSGRLFVIRDVTVWRLSEPDGGGFGVAAFFRQYEYL